MDWWNDLGTAAKVFYCMAAFFSVFLIWQIIAALLGMGGDDDGQADHDGDMDHGDDHHDAAASTAAFKLLSVRSVVTFFTLFAWAGALYLTGSDAVPLWQAMTWGLVWGLIGMVVVATIFYLMRRLTESGNVAISQCVGTNATVYLDIPSGGCGQVRVLLGGRVSFIKARARGTDDMKAGTAVTVLKTIDATTVEVGPTQSA
ncbi:MAG: hypothetical protein ABFD92_12315 [Planctomycetaceae bacterium]|nr:hypothetical protein [Planctomycetaceae bacterium]